MDLRNVIPMLFLDLVFAPIYLAILNAKLGLESIRNFNFHKLLLRQRFLDFIIKNDREKRMENLILNMDKIPVTCYNYEEVRT
jgi:hypothetical protein